MLVDGPRAPACPVERGGETNGAEPAGTRSPQTASSEVFFSRQQRRLLGRQDTWRDLGLLWQGTHERQAPGPGDRVELWGSSWLPK